MNNAVALTAMTAHIRKRIKVAGIKARVRVAPGGGSIQVFVPKYEAEFSHDEQRTIRTIAKVNGLTWVRGLEIDPERMTEPKSFSFYLADRELSVMNQDGQIIATTDHMGVAKLYLADMRRRGERGAVLANADEGST